MTSEPGYNVRFEIHVEDRNSSEEAMKLELVFEDVPEHRLQKAGQQAQMVWEAALGALPFCGERERGHHAAQKEKPAEGTGIPVE